MSAAVDIGTLIVKTPDTCGGRPRIAGHRVTVQNIAIDYKAGMSAEEIAKSRPTLTLAEVYVALAYYHANAEQIEAAIAEDEAEYERLEAEYSVGKRQ